MRDASRVEPVERRELRNFPLELVKVGPLLLPGMDQDRHPAPHRNVAKLGRRSVEEGSAGEGQRAYQPVAERIMEHGRASPDEWKPICSSASSTVTSAWADSAAAAEGPQFRRQ